MGLDRSSAGGRECGAGGNPVVNLERANAGFRHELVLANRGGCLWLMLDQTRLADFASSGGVIACSIDVTRLTVVGV